MVQIAHLHKRFGKVQALDGLSLNVFKHDIYGLLGPNGSGKSTTIRILLSLVKPDDGVLNIFGNNISKANNGYLKEIGALVERPTFYEQMSASRNLSVFLKYSGRKADPSLISKTLELVGLKERGNDRVAHYSEGMKQRLGIAQAIIHNPTLLILDEPFNNLDPEGVKDMRDLLKQLNTENGMTIIISSHKLDEMEKLSNRMILIREGKSLAEGTISDLLKKGKVVTKIVSEQLAEASQVIDKSGFDIRNLGFYAGSLHIECEYSLIPQVNKLLVQHDIDVEQLVPDLSLESFFLSIMKNNEHTDD